MSIYDQRTTQNARALASVIAMVETIRIRDLQVGQVIVFDDGPDCECVGCQPIGGDLFIIDWTEPDGSAVSTAPTLGGRPVNVRMK